MNAITIRPLPTYGFRMNLSKAIADEAKTAALCPSRTAPSCLREDLHALDRICAAQGMDIPAATRIPRLPGIVNILETSPSPSRSPPWGRG
jgi:hypothetical protein